MVFDKDGGLVDALPRWFSIPLPVILDPLPVPFPGRGVIRSIVNAAKNLATLGLITSDEFGNDLSTEHLGLVITPSESEKPLPFIPCYLEVDPGWKATLEEMSTACAKATVNHPEPMLGCRVALSPIAAEASVELTRQGVAVVHLLADEMGRDTSNRPLTEAIREVHGALVKANLRDRVTLIASGGIAATEHVVKAIACGVDAVAIDFAMQIAWGCSLWADKGKCYVENEDIDPEWGSQRVVNLMSAWRDQMLEALGAMGIREIRRLQGEVGRTIWHKTEDAAFRELLGNRKPIETLPRLKVHARGEGDFRWAQTLLLASQQQARTGQPPVNFEWDYRFGASDGGFDKLAFDFEFEMDPANPPVANPKEVDLSLPLNRRNDGRPEVRLPLPWYGAGMSYGSISLPVMIARAKAAKVMGTFISTGEGGYPEELASLADHIITQVATGLFGVREETIQRARVVEIKYAQGVKPGLDGHLLGNKNTETVARIREAVHGTSLFSPFPFHSVYSVEDHKKHVDWLKQVNEQGLVSVKVSTPTDVDMVAVGAYYAGARIVHLDGAYGGTGAAPEIAKKNIAMPIKYAIPKVHNFPVEEGIRDEATLMVSGGLRSAWDVAKAIALGADGAILGTAELVAIGCIRIAQCEKGLGCPFGITTTDPVHAKLVNANEATQRIINLYTSYLWQLAGILKTLGMASIRELRGRSDLLVYLV